MSRDPRVRVVDGHKAAELIGRTLEEFQKDETELFFECMSKAGKMAKKDVISASPKGPKDYAKGWSIRTKREKFGINVLIFNKTHPGLTHLLEKSHLISNGTKRVFGETSPGHGQVIHIKPARDKAEEYLLDLLMERLL